MIRIESQLSRENVPASGKGIANYLLVKLCPTDAIEARPLPLNVSLVIDNSGSMYGSDQRIDNAIAAACQAVDMLGSDDVVSVVAFSDHGRTFQSSASARDKESIKRTIRSIKAWDSGGTRLYKGMEHACAEVERHLSADRVNRVLLLTDGNTEGESTCEAIAQRETQKGVTFSTFGVGDDWNEDLLRRIAELGRGSWRYIDAATKIPQFLQDELGHAQQTYLNNVTLTAALRQGVAVTKVRQVEPEIADLVTDTIGDRELVVKLGSMQKAEKVFLLLYLSLAGRKSGQYRIADLIASYAVPSAGSGLGRTDPHPVLVTYTTDPQQFWQNGDVLRYVDMEHVDAMVRRGTRLAVEGDKARATQLLVAAAQVSGRTGNDTTTKLIMDALDELGASGKMDKKTQLKLADSVRKTSLMLEDEDVFD